MLHVYQKEALMFFLIVFSILTIISISVIEERKNQLNKAVHIRGATLKQSFLNYIEGFGKTISIADLDSEQAIEELKKNSNALIWINNDLQINKVIYSSSKEMNLKNNFNEDQSERLLLRSLSNSNNEILITKNLGIFPHSTGLSFVRAGPVNLEKEFFLCSIKLKNIIKELDLKSLGINIVIENENHQDLYSSYKKKKHRLANISETITINSNEYLTMQIFPSKKLIKEYLFLNLRFLVLISGLVSLCGSIIFFKLKANHLKHKLLHKIIYFFNETEREETNLKLQGEISNLQKLRSRTTGFCNT